MKIIYYIEDKDYYTKDKIQEIINLDGKILQNNKNSLVKLIQDNDKKIIIKEPRGKNKRKWVRLNSIFKKSRAVKAMESMKILNGNGIITNIPIVAVEYRKYQMVVSSYMIFEYLDGDKIEEKDIPLVLEMLKNIHKLGYCHGDCHKGNFLKTKKGIATIDCVLKPKRFLFFSENIQSIKFLSSIGKENELYEFFDLKSIKFKISKFLYDFKQKIKIIKKKVRKNKHA